MSSITDKPISSNSEDLLKVEKYSEALSKFISNSNTPITIGLQGEWGTGKTSLMSLLLEEFNKDGKERKIATSWVNTWEYSMFKGAKETTPGVLRAMLDKLRKENEDVWTLPEKAVANFKKALGFLGAIGNQIIANQTGVNVGEAASGLSSTEEKIAEIAEIKKLIADLIDELVNHPENSIEKVVFFVDDLDRIPPSDAVEVLESLKNIFDIPYCVFILAIDYDVVVKGLESKFGPKTDENEREFRSFFDKIIQVPFSMPVGTYDIENFLVEKLKTLNVEIDDKEKELFAKAVKFTIGFNPRSLKRYLNSFSLINDIRAIENSDDDQQQSGDDFMLFALLGIQISFPNIFRLLTQNPDFTSWNKGFANKFGIEWAEIEKKIEKFGENELIDEEWEKVSWGSCQKDPYLKAKAFSVNQLLNLLRDKYKDTLVEEVEAAMAFASITSVDDDVESKQAVQKVGNKTIFSGLETKLVQLSDEGFPTEAINNYNALWSILEQKLNDKYRISFAKTGTSFNDESKVGRGNKQLIYCTNPSKKALGMKIWVKNNTGKSNLLFEKLKAKYNLHESELIYISKQKDLILEYSLSIEIGDRYHSLLADIVDEIT